MRPIDADALIKTIDSHCYPVQHDMTSIEPGMTRIGILQAIQEQPTIDPERKKGKWIDKSGGIEGAWNYCSVCGEQAIDLYDFCPNCGADMRGESDD
jgi:hypothetical protein